MRGHWIVAATAVLALTGCEAEGPAPAPVPATAAPVTFAASVQEKVPEVALDRREEELEAIGEQTCAALTSGEPAEAVLTGTGTDDRPTARRLVTLAIGTLCPDQSVRAAEFG